MTYLLDTHVLLWLLGEPSKVPPRVQEVLADRSNDVFVSAASALEIATKVRLGKLDEARVLVDGWSSRLQEIGMAQLAVTGEHALLAGSMSWSHRDPFDRMLVAQASVENLVLVSTDDAIKTLPGVRLLTW